MKKTKKPARELEAPPVTEVRWAVVLASSASPKLSEHRRLTDHVLARGAFDAWKRSQFYVLGYAFSAVSCVMEKP